MPLGQRVRVARPVSNVYPMRAGCAGWVAPVAPSNLGRGPSQFLGVYDTRPELEPYDDQTHRALSPLAMPGGACLRWSLPRALRYEDSGALLSAVAPAHGYAASLTLYVAGVDVLPLGWRDAPTWPGLPTGYVAQASDINLDSTLWELGLTAAQVGPGATALSDAGADAADGLRYLARHSARPVLDLLSYSGAPCVEADLSELAGGARYVAAWLRLWWPCWSATDPFAAVALDIPWTVVAGPSRFACHRDAWHVGIPVVGKPLAFASWATDVLEPNAAVARYGVASPVAGTWAARVCSNARAADGADSLQIAVEFRNSDRVSTTTTSVDYNEHGAVIAPSLRHGGSAVVIAAYPNTLEDPIAGLVSLSVVP